VDLHRPAAGVVDCNRVKVGAVVPSKTTKRELKLVVGWWHFRQRCGGVEEEALVATGGGENVDLDLVRAGVAEVDAEEVRLAVPMEAGNKELPIRRGVRGERSCCVDDELGVVAALGHRV